MIRVLDRSVSIIQAVASSKGMTLSEISKQVSLPFNTTLRILMSLMSHGLVEQNSQSKIYTLGRRVLAWSLQVSYPPPLVEVTSIPMQELSKKTGEDVGFAINNNGFASIIHTIMGPEPLKIIHSLNNQVPLHCGAFRRVLLAHQDDSWIEEYLTASQYVAFTDTTVLDKAVIREDIARIRQNGFCVSHGEYVKGCVGMAVPVFGLYEEFLGSVFIVGPNLRISGARIPLLVQGLKDTAQAIKGNIRGEAPCLPA